MIGSGPPTDPGRVPEERAQLLRQRNAELDLEPLDLGWWHCGLEVELDVGAVLANKLGSTSMSDRFEWIHVHREYPRVRRTDGFNLLQSTVEHRA
jgi:hypothetical protein